MPHTLGQHAFRIFFQQFTVFYRDTPPFVGRLRTKAPFTESLVPSPPHPTPPPLAKVQLNARSSPTVPSSSIPAASSPWWWWPHNTGCSLSRCSSCYSNRIRVYPHSNRWCSIRQQCCNTRYDTERKKNMTVFKWFIKQKSKRFHKTERAELIVFLTFKFLYPSLLHVSLSK